MALFQYLKGKLIKCSDADESACRSKAMQGVPCIKNENGIDVMLSADETSAIQATWAQRDKDIAAVANAPKAPAVQDQIAKLTQALMDAKIPIPS